MRTALGALLPALLFLCASCTPRDGTVQFDASEPLAVQPGVEWAVVSVPYAACYADADYASPVAGHFRRGAVLQVTGERSIATSGSEHLRAEVWYAFESGWLPGSAVQVYSNKLRAENAARLLLAQ